MALAIKPLSRRRHTAQRGKPINKSQRWGKVVTIMPLCGDCLYPINQCEHKETGE
jgi:hypothetical protein